ncbi:MAG: HPP family protein [Desulfurivibrio sp.]
MNYFIKMRGGGNRPPRVGAAYIGWSWLGALLGIAAVAGLHYGWLGDRGLVMIIGSFGASAVLIYGAINSPLAQPRNLVGGHFISAVVGVACYQLLPEQPGLAAALAVATAIAAMQLSGTLHPPGGATALIAVIGGEEINSLGFLYVLIPATSGALVMLLVALLINNLAPDRKYPEYW